MILDKIKNPVQFYTDRFVKEVKKKIFGENNERLDFLMDSFYKLEPTHRMAVLVGGGVASLFSFVVVLYFYFFQISVLDNELNESFNALYELRQLKSEYKMEEAKFNNLVATVSRKTSGLRLKPFFEQKATDLGVKLQGLTDQNAPLPVENPMSKNLQYAKAEMRMSPISIPKLLDFVTEIEKSNNYLSIENFEIRGRYNDKLFFDASVKFRGYSSEGKL